MIDFHTHILPGIDDGAKDISTSVKMLKMLYNEGVECVVATPHFDAEKDNLNEFLSKRDKAYNLIMEEAKKKGIQIPKICLGAEVKIVPHLSEICDLSKLCIASSNYILLEMPFNNRSMWIFDEIYSITIYKKLVPVMAHIDRYIRTKDDFSFYTNLFDMNVCFQVNQECYFSFSSRRKAKKLASYDAIQVIGTDCHNLTDRKPDFAKCVKLMKKCHGSEFTDKIFQNGKVIINM